VKSLNIYFSGSSLDLDKKALMKAVKKLNKFDNHMLSVIEKQNEFNINNIIVDNILSDRLKQNGFDVFIRLDQNNDIFEIFDINNLFIKD
jgi:hypothetical protein